MESNNKKRVEFTPPKEFTLPETAMQSGEFDLVCSFHVKPDGKICLVKLGETKMPGYDKEEREEENEHRPDYGELTRGIQEGMNMDGGHAPGPQSSGY